MEARKVLVEKAVIQVCDGSHYEGYVKFADIKFDYVLVFGVSIPQLGKVEEAKDGAEVRRRFQLILQRENVDIELSDQEYALFLALIGDLVLDFYNNSNTRESNKDILDKTGRPLTNFGASPSIGMMTTGLYLFYPKDCEILSASKFGCKFVS